MIILLYSVIKVIQASRRSGRMSELALRWLVEGLGFRMSELALRWLGTRAYYKWPARWVTCVVSTGAQLGLASGSPRPVTSDHSRRCPCTRDLWNEFRERFEKGRDRCCLPRHRVPGTAYPCDSQLNSRSQSRKRRMRKPAQRCRL
jgi:hypothetical protein